MVGASMVGARRRVWVTRDETGHVQLLRQHSDRSEKAVAAIRVDRDRPAAAAAAAAAALGATTSPAPALVEQASGSLAAPRRGELIFESVSFTYPSRPTQRVLSKLSLRVPGGQRLAIVGGSGSGKSTIFALALRFYAAGRGRVLLDGQDVLTMDEADLRRQIAWVQQEPPLFPNTTVRENIAYGLVDCPMERIEAAAKEANAYEFVMGLPQGFETRIGAAGASLSGGQKQRVALARALVRDPSLLLLDEATSALDPESEQLVEAAIARAAAERTVLFTTHKVAQARNADRIIVLAHGVIVEEGSHNELLRRNGAYAQLVRASKGGGVSEAEAGALIDQAAGIVEEDPLPPELAIGTV
jgi:ABC-type multidrug transport system fused ATPase/permease subunit